MISRFRVSKDDPNKADPKSEEVLFTYTHPYWNHKGGNVVFGPDGYLYIGLGDGGAANDPHGNGQNLKTLLGKILRIDVDRKGNGKPYAIPTDNPFVGKEGADPRSLPTACGIRGACRSIPRRSSSGSPTSARISGKRSYIIEKGGNYGWNVREGFHKFDVNNAKPGPGRTPAQQNKLEGPDDAKFIEPIWEYHHDDPVGGGKSITGGAVYRGSKAPGLVGHYVYADYVSGKIWGLKYDEKAKKVVANRPIAGPAAFPNPPVHGHRHRREGRGLPVRFVRQFVDSRGEVSGAGFQLAMLNASFCNLQCSLCNLQSVDVTTAIAGDCKLTISN